MSDQILNLGPYMAAVRARLKRLEEEEFSPRLWQKDPSLWKEDPKHQLVIRNALGWLDVVGKMEKNLEDFSQFTANIKASGFKHIVHMGMGGSSLAPLTFQRAVPRPSGGLPITVLDTTDPATILRIERSVPLGETLFIVASKSGTTAEPAAFGEYFYAKVKAIKGPQAGENCVAITDPETPLVKLAQERGFRRIFWGCQDIGGRFSALSHFGLIPITLMGLNVGELLSRAKQMVQACSPSLPLGNNPGIILGAALGELALQGRDKLTLILPESISSLGLWLEQLLAESTGKEGKGILPVDGELIGEPPIYGQDRVFVYIHLAEEKDERFERSVKELQKTGQPVITIQMNDRLDLVQEFFRWEIATATAGAILQINPFDQPNVQESKDNTYRFLAKVRQEGRLPDYLPTLQEDPLSFFTDEKGEKGRDLLKAFLAKAQPGDFFALQVYLPDEPETTKALQIIRRQIRHRLGLATTMGYGPRYLHSTGQFHKGGPNKGLFLQMTADDREDALIPGSPYSFGTFKMAQAMGDLEALKAHGRRALSVHLGKNITEGLEILIRIIEEAFKT